MQRLISILITLAIAVPLTAQSASSPRELTFQVSPSTPWTDTALDLHPGDSITISVVSSGSLQSLPPRCDPAGLSNNSANTSSLPAPEAGTGALIAKLQADGTPILIGARGDLHIDKASHLFLGMNVSGSQTCRGAFEVKVQVPASGSRDANVSDSQQPSRGSQLKSQLANAAQVFMSEQFGISKPATSAENASSASSATGTEVSSALVVRVSDAPLDADLRKQLDNLPRRVNDQFNNLGDMVNFVIVGSQKDVQAALEVSDWHVADTDNRKAVLNAVMETYDKKDYLAMPMSTLYLFGRKQDFGYEMAEPIAMVASRHHFRIWKAPFTWKEQEVWVGAGTHDIGFAKDKRNNSVTHKIDPAVDGERDNIGASLQKSNKAKTFSYYLPANPVQEAKNATGDGYHSDGRLLVVLLQ